MLDKPESAFNIRDTVYADEILHLVNEIRAICQRERIPYAMVFQTKLEPHEQDKSALVPTMTATAQLFKGQTGTAMQAVGFVSTHADFAHGLAMSFDQVTNEPQK